ARHANGNEDQCHQAQRQKPLVAHSDRRDKTRPPDGCDEEYHEEPKDPTRSVRHPCFGPRCARPQCNRHSYLPQVSAIQRSFMPLSLKSSDHLPVAAGSGIFASLPILRSPSGTPSWSFLPFLSLTSTGFVTARAMTSTRLIATATVRLQNG